MTKQNMLLIINPISGRKKAKRYLYKIVDLLCRNDYKTTIFTTARQGEATSIVKEYAREFQKIICCGGDGTLNEVFAGLAMLNHKMPVGYMPTGTMNDLAHALDLPVKINKAMDTAINGHARALDIGVLNADKYFAYVASFGAFTEVSYTTPQWLKNIIGRISYVFSGILRIGDIRPHSVKVIADGKEFSGNFIYGSVSNSTIIGGIIKLPKPDVCFDDGQFEVLLIKNPKTRKELRAILRGIVHQSYDEKYVYYFKAKTLSFVFDEAAEWSIDGEYAGTLDKVHIANLHKMAQIVV